jgi:putative redox protein
MDAENITAITELDQSRYRTKVYSGGHFIYADEPASLGGTDEGMNPYALLLASLGSCTAITIRMYADRKGFLLEHIKIELSLTISKDLIMQTRIVRNLTLTGDLTQEQRAKLSLIADKCPIHKVLTNPIIIETTRL